MRILSVNAWGGALLDPLADWLATCDADVVCLQEVTRTPGVGGWTTFDDGERSLPQRANLFDDVRAVLPDHQGIFLASDAGPVCADDGRHHHQDFGLATFVHERIPMVGGEATFVHGTFVDHRRWSILDRPRLAHAIRLVDRPGERSITVAHVHGLRDPSGKHDTPSRLRQAQRLTDVVTRVRRPDDLTIVCGDLNVLPDSRTFEILGAVGLTDLVGCQDTRTSHYTGRTRHADYLLISHPDAVTRFEIVRDPEVSDHRALLVDL